VSNWYFASLMVREIHRTPTATPTIHPKVSAKTAQRKNNRGCMPEKSLEIMDAKNMQVLYKYTGVYECLQGLGRQSFQNDGRHYLHRTEGRSIRRKCFSSTFPSYSSYLYVSQITKSESRFKTSFVLSQKEQLQRALLYSYTIACSHLYKQECSLG
jgi:hypothetical protein